MNCPACHGECKDLGLGADHKTIWGCPKCAAFLDDILLRLEAERKAALEPKKGRKRK